VDAAAAADVVAHADAAVAAVQDAEPADAALAVADAAVVVDAALAGSGSACHGSHVQVVAHPGGGAAGARRQRLLIVYRQSMISLAGLASDPANLRCPPPLVGNLPMTGEYVPTCTNNCRSTSLHVFDRTSGWCSAGDLK
jgi:hypothetical protein